jgi:hypothetical protein
MLCLLFGCPIAQVKVRVAALTMAGEERRTFAWVAISEIDESSGGEADSSQADLPGFTRVKTERDHRAIQAFANGCSSTGAVVST